MKNVKVYLSLNYTALMDTGILEWTAMTCDDLLRLALSNHIPWKADPSSFWELSDAWINFVSSPRNANLCDIISLFYFFFTITFNFLSLDILYHAVSIFI